MINDLFISSLQDSAATCVKCWSALGLHGRGETVLEDCLALGLVHRGAVLGEGGNCNERLFMVINLVFGCLPCLTTLTWSYSV